MLIDEAADTKSLIFRFVQGKALAHEILPNSVAAEDVSVIFFNYCNYYSLQNWRIRYEQKKKQTIVMKVVHLLVLLIFGYNRMKNTYNCMNKSIKL